MGRNQKNPDIQHFQNIITFETFRASFSIIFSIFKLLSIIIIIILICRKLGSTEPVQHKIKLPSPNENVSIEWSIAANIFFFNKLLS